MNSKPLSTLYYLLPTVFCVLSICYLLSTIYSFSPVRAETELPAIDQPEVAALTITPSIYEGVLIPGQTTTAKFEIKNNSRVPLPIKCYIRNFEASDEVGGVNIPEEPDEVRLSPRNWIEVENPDFVFQPQTTREVAVNFNTPSDLSPGGQYAILFIEPLLPQSMMESSSLQIGGRLGALLFLVAPGDAIERAKLMPFDYRKYVIGNILDPIKIRVENEGNVHVKASGKATVTNKITGKKIILNVPEFTIMPGKVRQETVDIVDIKWPGLYTVQSQLKYGRDNQSLEKDFGFIYLPIAYIFATIILICLIVFLTFGKLRKRLFKAVKVVIKG